MLKKHLIFHFFIPDDYETNIAIRMHYACLHKYSGLFDSAEVVISYTKDSEKYIKSVQFSLLNVLKIRDVRMIVKENDLFCEAQTLNEYFCNNIQYFNNTLVFFAHTKGVTNVNSSCYYEYGIERFLMWIYALYFYSLEFIDEVENMLIFAHLGRIRAIYGPMQTKSGDGVFYPGAFYWLNPMTIKNDINSGEISLPLFDNRVFAERFPLMYKYVETPKYRMGKSDGHNGVISNDGDFDHYYGDFDEIIKYYGEYDLYMKGYNEMLKQIQ